MKKILAILTACAIVISVSACNAKRGEVNEYNSTEDLTENDISLTSAPEEVSGGVWYCNRFRSEGEPPFAMPEGIKEADEYGIYSIRNFSEESYDSFIQSLVNDGFVCGTTKYGALLFRSDCAVFLRYYDSDLEFYWYAESPDAPESGMTAAEAKKLIYPEESRSQLDIQPIDVTPEGLYQRTGWQVFACPSYSFDIYPDALHIKENEWYDCRVFVVKGDRYYYTDYENIAVGDIDGDGDDELMLLHSGPTSGTLTYEISIVTEERADRYLFQCNYTPTSFCEKDGRPALVASGSVWSIVPKVEKWHTVLTLQSGDRTVESISRFAKMITEVTILYSSETDGPRVETAKSLLTEEDYYDIADGVKRRATSDLIDGLKCCTSVFVRETTDNIDLFQTNNAYFIRIGYKMYRYDSFGGGLMNMCLWDYDNDGTKDIVFVRSWGSGFGRISVTLIDVKKLIALDIITVPEALHTIGFDFDGINVYINGSIVEYRDGAFCFFGPVTGHT